MHTHTAHVPHIQPFSRTQDVLFSSTADQLPDGAEVLVRTLCRSLDENYTYKEALARLNGANNRTSEQWTDHYLEHKHEIDALVSRIRDKTFGKQKQQVVDDPQYDDDQGEEEGLPLGSSTPTPTGMKPRSQSIPRPRHIRRSSEDTIPPSSSIRVRIPDIPTSEPQPPSCPATQISVGRNAFTPEEKSYLAKFMVWEYSRNPYIGTTLLAKKMAKKLPQHPESFWLSCIYYDSIASAIVRHNREERERHSMATVTKGSESTHSEVRHDEEVEHDQHDEDDKDNKDGKAPVHKSGNMHPLQTDLESIARFFIEFPACERMSSREKGVAFVTEMSRRATRDPSGALPSHPPKSYLYWSKIFRDQGSTIAKLVEKHRKGAFHPRKTIQAAHEVTPPNTQKRRRSVYERRRWEYGSAACKRARVE